VVQECTSNCGDPIQESDDTPHSRLRRSDDSSNYTEEFFLVKRDGQTINAHNVDDEVALISLPRGRVLGKDFIYDNTAGAGQTIYIVDTGAGLNNADVTPTYEESKIVLTNQVGVFKICYSEQKIPPSLGCEAE